MATTMDKFFINDIAEVQDKKLGVVRGYAVAEKLRREYPGINVVDVDSITDGLQRVESGELFGYIDNLMTIAASIQKDFTGTLKVSSRLADGVQLGVATRNDEPLLHEVFQKLVSSMNQETQQGFFNKWVSVKQEMSIDYRMVWKVVAIVLLLLAFLYHYSKLRKLNGQLRVLSNTDKLTGLYNRLKIDAVLNEQKNHVDRYGSDVSLILMDIDFFKQVNDRWGHATGDKVLVDFATILKANVRATDYVGRWGGEEFLIVCPNTDSHGARALAENLLQEVREHQFEAVGALRASAGVACLTRSLSINDVLHHADQALYQSKETGRNQVMVSEQDTCA